MYSVSRSGSVRWQRLLNHAVWDESTASAAVRDFVMEHLGDEFAVADFDESAQEKKGTMTVGVNVSMPAALGR